MERFASVAVWAAFVGLVGFALVHGTGIVERVVVVLQELAP